MPFPHILNAAARVCRSPDSWLWTDHSQISLMHSPTSPKCSTRGNMALINILGIVYHHYCSSSKVSISLTTGLFLSISLLQLRTSKIDGPDLNLDLESESGIWSEGGRYPPWSHLLRLRSWCWSKRSLSNTHRYPEDCLSQEFPVHFESFQARC